MPAEPHVFQVLGPGPGRLYIWLLILPILLLIFLSWVAAVIALVAGVVLVIVFEWAREARLKVIVSDRDVVIQSFTGETTVPIDDIRAIELVPAMTAASTQGYRVDLRLVDGSARVTPLRAQRGEQQESEVRAAAHELASLTGRELSEAR